MTQNDRSGFVTTQRGGEILPPNEDQAEDQAKEDIQIDPVAILIAAIIFAPVLHLGARTRQKPNRLVIMVMTSAGQHSPPQ